MPIMSRLKEILSDNKRNITIALFLILIISLSFGLGCLFARENNTKAPIIIEKCSSANQ